MPWLVLAAGLAAAQETVAPPRFPVAVDQVVVDVVVLDERGAHVAGLSRGDFLLQEDGATQELVSFEAVDVHPPAAASQRAAVAPTRATGKPSVSPRRTIVIVFDDLGLSPIDGERARAAVADFVKAEVASGDRLALASTSGRDRWVARTDEDIKDLHEVVSRLRGLASPDVSEQRVTDDEAYRIHVEHDAATAAQVADRYSAAGVMMGRALGDLVNANAAATYDRASRRALQTLAVLERSARSLQGVPGRKAVVLVSPGFFHEPGAAEYREVLGACREANVAVYFLNAASNETPSALAVSPVLPFGPPRPPEEGPPDEAGREQPGARQEAFAGAFAAMDRAASAGSERVADDTGGFVVRGSNELAGSLRRVAEDSRAYYLLGYVSTNAARDGRYRKITVRLSPRVDESGRRRQVRARPGYYAPTDAPPPAAASVAEEELRRVLDSPVERSDVSVRLAAYTLEDSKKTPGTVRCLLAAEVDGRALTLPPKGSRAEADLDVAYETVSRGEGARQRALKRVKLETPTRDWIHVEQEFLLPPGVHRVTVAVRDAASGRSGSTSARVDVPTTGAFRASTPVVRTGEADGKGRAHAAPSANREFASGDRVQVAFEVYGAASDPGSGRPRVSTACAVVNALPGAASRAPLQPVAPDQEGSPRRIVNFELAGVKPGDYLFVGRVVDEVAGRQLTFTEPFTVVAAEQRTADAPAPRATSDPELAALLERAGRYVVEYETALHDLAAEEEYIQHVRSGTSPGIAASAIRPGMAPAGSIGGSPRRDEPGPESRRTRADVVFARLAPPFPWATFRDVYEVDGARVRDRDGRLERAFREKPATAVAQAQAILAESARYNIGPERTVNLPTLPLLFLHPANQARFAFERKGGGSGGAPVEIAFREQKRPTMVRGVPGSSVQAEFGRGGDLPAEGRFWIDSRGTVVRSEVRFKFDFGGTATITTTYQAEPSLAMWVPAEMKEKYEGGGFGAGTDAVARYSRFRKFEVTIEEKARVPER